jgi:hypothetical protein
MPKIVHVGALYTSELDGVWGVEVLWRVEIAARKTWIPENVSSQRTGRRTEAAIPRVRCSYYRFPKVAED